MQGGYPSVPYATGDWSAHHAHAQAQAQAQAQAAAAAAAQMHGLAHGHELMMQPFAHAHSPAAYSSPIQQLQLQQQHQQHQMMSVMQQMQLAQQQQQQRHHQLQQHQHSMLLHQSPLPGMIPALASPAPGLLGALGHQTAAAFSSTGFGADGGATMHPAAAAAAAAAASHLQSPSHHARSRLGGRPTSERLVIKLTVSLMETFNQINDTYYANKRRKRAEQAEQASQAQQHQQLLAAQQQSAALAAAASSAAAAASSSAAAATAAASSSLPLHSSSSGLPPRRGVSNDGYDDAESNYLITENELLSNGRYQILQSIGKGSFGRVVKAWDHRDQVFVALKIIKSKPAFQKQALVELKLLTSLNKGIGLPTTAVEEGAAAGAASAASAAGQVSSESGVSATPASSSSSSSAAADAPGSECDRFGIVRMLDSFMHANHQCIVFELLSLNLYELLRTTRFSGVSLKLLGKFTQQLLMTLAYLSCKERGEARIIHCDLKPENILLRSSKKSAIKVIDFGSACFVQNKIYTYIQSRFYRAPEVILGLNYSAAIDMWSLGCICFELSSGSPLFDGQDEHDQILRHVQLLGLPPVAMLEKSKKAAKFFEKGFNGAWQIRDPLHASSSVAAAATFQKMQAANRGSALPAVVDPRANLRVRLGAKFVDQPLWHAFIDLILTMLAFDPLQRIKPAHALEHEFFLISRQIADAQAAAAAAVAAAAASGATGAVDLPMTSPSAAAAPVAASSNGHAAAASSLPPVQPLSSVFSDAAAAAFTYPHAAPLPPPIAIVAPPASAAAAAALVPEDASMQDASAAPAVAAPSNTAAAAASTAAASAHDVIDVTTPTDELHESKRKPAPAAATTHATPTRKRSVAQVDSGPPSPTAPQHTLKTRALAARQHAGAVGSAAALFTPRSSPRTRPAAAAAAAAAAAGDDELHALELPPISYQSPSLRSMNRQTSAAKRDSAHAMPPAASRSSRQHSHTAATASHAATEADVGAAAAASTPRLTRRTSELLQHHDLDSPQLPPSALPSSPQIHGMLTRRQSHALGSPPGSSPLSPGLHSHGHGHARDAWVATQERLLASDPLALALDDRAGAGPHPVALSQAHLKAPPRRTTRRKSSSAGGRRDASPDEPHRNGHGSSMATSALPDDPSSIARRELRATRRKASRSGGAGVAFSAGATGSSGGATDSGYDSHSGMDTDEPEDGPIVIPRRTRARSHEMDHEEATSMAITSAPVARKPTAGQAAAGGSARKARS